MQTAELVAATGGIRIGFVFQRSHRRRHEPPGSRLITAIGDNVNTCARLGNL